MEMDSLIKRKILGKAKQDKYDKLFKDLQPAELIELKLTDQIVEKLREKSKSACSSEEFVETDLSFIESDLLREVYLELKDTDLCYSFTDNFEYCGLYLAPAKRCFENAFELALKNETCFLLDTEFKYSFRINYYDKNHNDYPLKYDVKRNF